MRLPSDLRILFLQNHQGDTDRTLAKLRQAGFTLAGTRVVCDADFLSQLEINWDLIVADAQVVDMTVLRALAYLAERNLTIPVIIVSRCPADDELVVQAIKHGAADYLHPDRLDRLSRAVQQALDDRKLAAERQRLTDARHAREDHLRLALLAAGAVTWEVDFETGEMTGSDGLAPFFGLPAGTTHFPFTHAMEIIHPDDRARLLDAARTADELDVPYEVETRAVLRDGMLRWFSQRGQIVERDHAGHARRMMGITRDVTARKQAEEAVHDSAVRLADAERLAHLGSWDWNTVANRVIWSGELNRIFGRAAEQTENTLEDFLAQVHPEDLPRVHDVIERAMSTHESFSYECRIIRRDGSIGVIHGLGAAVLAADGTLARMQGTAQDITERTAIQAALHASEARFRAMVQNASDFIVVVDAVGICIYVSPSADRVLGFGTSELLGRSLADLRHPDDVAATAQFFGELNHRPGASGTTECRFRSQDGSWIWLDILATNLLDDPAVGGIVINARDITDHKELAEQLRHQAFHDPLTGLANRALINDRLTQALARASRTGTHVAVFFLDLDNFKVINDSLGHAAGDALLVAIARRLQRGLREGDTVARFGGDEFICVLEDLADATEAEVLAARLNARCQQSIIVGERSMIVTVSIGVVVSGIPVESSDDLLRHADQALYAAKRAGKARTSIFDPTMNAQAWERLDIEADLRHALAVHDLHLVYQPIYDLVTGAICDVEALVRWWHPRRGLISPADFIPVAEATELIFPLGRWVLEAACHCATLWPSPAGGRAPRVSVNLSARHITSALVHEVTAVLSRTGLSPDRLVLELTERVALQDDPVIYATLEALRDLGVALAIDDFGTGYSGLGSLKDAPVNILKIDQRFIAGLGTDQRDTGIITAILTMADVLGLDVIAEGIETVDQAAALRELGCPKGQGYALARSMSVESLAEVLASNGVDSTQLLRPAPPLMSV